MLVLVLGLPVPRVRGLLSRTVGTLAAAGIDADIYEADSLVRLAAHVASTTKSHTLMLVTLATHDWVQAIGAAGVPFAYLHTDPLPFVLEHDNQLDAARSAMMRLSSFSGLQAAPNCVRIDASNPAAEEQLLAFLSTRLERPVPFTGGTTEPGEPSTDETEGRPAGELDATVSAALRGFDSLNEGIPPRSVLVSRLLFSDAAREGAPVDRAIDATGRPRVLFYGPYAFLPAGIWRARIVVAVSEQLVGRSFGVEIAAGGGNATLAQSAFNIEIAGRRDMVVEFKHDDFALPIEVRFSSVTGIFDGTVSLGYVEFSRAEPDTQSLASPLVEVAAEA
jgi:hypothetical protein